MHSTRNKMFLLVLTSMAVVVVFAVALTAKKNSVSNAVIGATTVSDNKKYEFKHGFSIWVWEDTETLEKEGIKSFITFIDTNKINKIFLNVEEIINIKESNLSDGEKQTKLEELNKRYLTILQQSNEKGIEVHALCGSTEWASVDYKYIPLFIAEYIDNFNNTNSLKFKSLQLDIEYYNSSKYVKDNTKNKVSMAQDYLTLIDQLASKYSVPIGLAIPYWFNRENSTNKVTHNEKTQVMLAHIADILAEDENNYLAIMSYRNVATGSNGTLAIAEPVFNLLGAKASGIPIYIGQETAESYEPGVSFFEKSADSMSNAFKIIDKALGTNENYRGITIHSYSSYKRFLEETNDAKPIF